MVDIPPSMRSLSSYRLTLGHKANNAFLSSRNAEFETVRHPVAGPVACLVARRPIAAGEEVTVTYGYPLATAPAWYRAQYRAQRARTARAGGGAPGDS